MPARHGAPIALAGALLAALCLFVTACSRAERAAPGRVLARYEPLRGFEGRMLAMTDFPSSAAVELRYEGPKQRRAFVLTMTDGDGNELRSEELMVLDNGEAAFHDYHFTVLDRACDGELRLSLFSASAGAKDSSTGRTTKRLPIDAWFPGEIGASVVQSKIDPSYDDDDPIPLYRIQFSGVDGEGRNWSRELHVHLRLG
jgi:hypothetical protein